MINTGSELALLYNDVHVLVRLWCCLPFSSRHTAPHNYPTFSAICRPAQENHHAHVLFTLLEETKVLSHMPQADRKLLRKLMVDAILSTDMVRPCPRHRCPLAGSVIHMQTTTCYSREQAAARVRVRWSAISSALCVLPFPLPQAQHKDLVARVQKHANGELPPLRPELIDDRLVLVSLLLHCADLHTPTLEPHISKRIADSLSDEFEAQARCTRVRGNICGTLSGDAPTVFLHAPDM